MSELLFGIGGIERSGTTLLVSKLSAHPDVAVVDDDEILMKKECFTKIKNKQDLNQIIDYFIQYYTENEKRWNLNYEYFELLGQSRNELISGASFPCFLVDLYPHFLQVLSKKEKQNARFVGFKTANLLSNPYSYFAIKSTFPKLKFVYIVRDPAANCAAMMHYHRTTAEEAVKIFKKHFNKFFAATYLLDHVYRLKYEDLVNPEMNAMEGVLDYLGLSKVNLGNKINFKGRESYLGSEISVSKNDERLSGLNIADREYIYKETEYLRYRLGYINDCKIKSNVGDVFSLSEYRKIERKGIVMNFTKRTPLVSSVADFVKASFFKDFNFWTR